MSGRVDRQTEGEEDVIGAGFERLWAVKYQRVLRRTWSVLRDDRDRWLRQEEGPSFCGVWALPMRHETGPVQVQKRTKRTTLFLIVPYLVQQLSCASSLGWALRSRGKQGRDF